MDNASAFLNIEVPVILLFNIFHLQGDCNPPIGSLNLEIVGRHELTLIYRSV
jgi:hypothetical protein